MSGINRYYRQWDNGSQKTSDDSPQQTTIPWRDFPTAQRYKALKVGGEVRAYFETHNIDADKALKNEYWYEVQKGICFILTGGLAHENHAYTTRHISDEFCGESLGEIQHTRGRWYNPQDITLGDFCYIPWSFQDVQRRIYVPRVYLVEGPTDALRLHLSGYLAIGVLGVSLTPQRVSFITTTLVQLEALYGTHFQLIFIQDNDGPGTKLALRASRIFHGLAIVRLPEGRKDICDVPDETLPMLLKLR